jgi:hypothetical protein
MTVEPEVEDILAHGPTDSCWHRKSAKVSTYYRPEQLVLGMQ